MKKITKHSLRESSGKTSGGQVGHSGQTLRAVEKPDSIIVHSVSQCSHCQHDLTRVKASSVEKRQVFEAPEIVLAVSEHQAEWKDCPQCGKRSRASFPVDVRHITQYGPRFRAQLVYFHSGQFIPLARTAEMVGGLYQQPVSEATILAAVAEMAKQVAPVNEALKTYLVETAEAVHFDETGLRVYARLHWLHSAGTTQATFYSLQAKRGSDGMDGLGILSRRHGWSVHDGWRPYFKYDVRHALCNAHHLRELTFMAEQYPQQWAVDLRHWLCQIKKSVERARSEGRKALLFEQIAYFNQRYTAVLYNAEDEIGLSPPTGIGHQKNSPAANLLNWLTVGREQVLAFMTDFKVPFDNNLAERDVRMMKVQQKVSGGFRRLTNAENFCAVRGYIATARKNGQAALAVSTQALSGNPNFPPCVAPASS